MEDVMRKIVKENLGKRVKIILNNNWIYSGKIVNCDDNYIKILDSKTERVFVKLITDIKSLEELE